MRWEDRDPVNRPSAMAQASIEKGSRRTPAASSDPGFLRDFLRILAVSLLVGLVVLLLFSISGCSTTGEQRVRVIREGRALLRKPLPGDPEWEERRRIFLDDAEAAVPTTPAGEVK